jgi:hypothetical protein
VKIRLFLISILLGAGASFLIPEIAIAQSQVIISATVLEHLTCIKNNGQYQITTNFHGGYWEIISDNIIAVVARY